MRSHCSFVPVTLLTLAAHFLFVYTEHLCIMLHRHVIDTITWRSPLGPIPASAIRRASQRARKMRLAFPEVAATKLSVEAVLKGHRGCVNRLAWNESGTLLASGSDDRQILIWHYPDTQHPPLVVETQHHANIFGVKFIPATQDTRLVSGAMDCTVQLHTLDHPPLHAPKAGSTSTPANGTRRGGGSGGVPMPCTSQVYGCHRGRVKCVEVEPGNPHLFWSGGEDGFVRQFDARLSTTSQDAFSSPNALIQLPGTLGGSSGRRLEVKSLALNRVRPHLMAVGAGDEYVRVYDRRMGALGPPQHLESPCMEAVLKLAPPHLSLWPVAPEPYSRMHVTCVSFGHRGDKLVASYHNDHVYSFDVSGAGAAAAVLSSAGAGAASAPASPSSPSGASPLNPPAPLDLFRGMPTPPAPQHRMGEGGGEPEEGEGGAGSRGAARGLSWGVGRGAAHGTSPRGSLSESALPEAAQKLKAVGNRHFLEDRYLEAVTKYSQALRLAPTAAGLYTNRALALIRREWEGDGAAALLDCETALGLDPGCARCHFRRAQALSACKYFQAASTACRLYRRQFPSLVGDGNLIQLEEEIAAELAKRAQQEEMRQQQRARRREARRRQGLNLERTPSRRPASQQPPQPPAPGSAAGQGEGVGRGVGGEGRELPPEATQQAQQDAAQQAQQHPLHSAEPLGGNPESPPDVAAAAPLRAAPAAPADAAGAADAASTAAGAGFLGEGALLGDVATSASGGPPPSARTAQRTPSAGASPQGRGSVQMEEGGQRGPSPASGHEPSTQADAGDTPSPATRFLRRATGGGEEGEPEGEGSEDSEGAGGWMELWGDGGVSGSEEGGAAEGWGRDHQYADALNRAYQQATGRQQQQAAGPEGLSAAGNDLRDHRNGFIGPPRPPSPPPSRLHHPSLWSATEGGRRMLQRFVGGCNVQTDIKEATFLGPNDELVACGSDDGRVYIFSSPTGECIRVLKADGDVANCVQCHPLLPVVATSGIDRNIKVWSPESVPSQGGDLPACLRSTQDAMRRGPRVFSDDQQHLEVFAMLTENPLLLRTLLRGVRAQEGAPEEEEEGGGEEEGEAGPHPACRVT